MSLEREFVSAHRSHLHIHTGQRVDLCTVLQDLVTFSRSNDIPPCSLPATSCPTLALRTAKPGGHLPHREATTGLLFCHLALCQMMDSNQRRQSRRIYSPLPLAARAIWHAPFGALVTLLRVAPTYANRQLKQLSGSYPARPAGSEATPPATPDVPRRSPSSDAAPESPGSQAAWPTHPRHTGGSAVRPQRTSRGLRSHG